MSNNNNTNNNLDLEVCEMEIPSKDDIEGIFDLCCVDKRDRQLFILLGCKNLDDLMSANLFDNYLSALNFLVYYPFENDNSSAMSEIERIFSLAAVAGYHNIFEISNPDIRESLDSQVRSRIEDFQESISEIYNS